MPRTSHVIAKTHSGNWVLLSNPDVPLMQQLQKFRLFRGTHSHEKFATVLYQESDGVQQRIDLRTPEAHKAHIELRATENKRLADGVAADRKREEAARTPSLQKQLDAANKELAIANELLEQQAKQESTESAPPAQGDESAKQ